MTGKRNTTSSSPSLPESCPLLRDPQAADEWTVCCSRYFRPLARRVLGDESLAEDALQEAWTKVLRAVYAFEGGPTACHWVRVIVTNSARDIRRRRVRSGAVMVTDVEQQDPAPSPEVQALDSEMVRVLREMVARLPAPYREVIELRFEQELSTRETAKRLEISRSNAATRLNRGLRLLRTRFRARMRSGARPL